MSRRSVRAESPRRGARPALRALADRAGILPEYLDQTGTERRVASDATRVALLAALGVDASSEEAAQHALAVMDADDRARWLAPVSVRPARAGRAGIEASLPEGFTGAVEWRLELTREDGAAAVVTQGQAAATRNGRVRIPCPSAMEPGYYAACVALRNGAEERQLSQTLILTPRACPLPAAMKRGKRTFGITANLYAVRSEGGWGTGTFSDLRALLEWTGEMGGDFVGVNPLHALRNTATGISPYSPVSRLFRNPLYLDPYAIPELADAPAARALLALQAGELAALRDAPRVDYPRIYAILAPLLRILHGVFVERHRGRDTERGRAYDQYLRAEGEALDDFATFVALTDHFIAQVPALYSWQQWPAAYRNPRSPEVVAFRRDHPETIDLHRYVQFELDRQLALAADAASDRGLAIGVYQDLAIGTAADGSDTWAFPGLFVQGASVGAPPDALAPQGQNWALPPIDPRRLRDSGYRYWRCLLRAALQHAGALRIDHVMGLFRQFWIPQGFSGKDGAYVRFPVEDLLGILALESTRAGAIVVGEDLGTVPPEVPPTLAAWRILSSKVLYFERTRRGEFRRAAKYPALSLATANTHDLPTIASYWSGADIDLRAREGVLPTTGAVRKARLDRQHDRLALVHRLRADHVLDGGPRDPLPPADVIARSVHRFLRRTPAVMVGIALDDLAGEVEPVNLPGVGLDQYASWSRRQGKTLEALRAVGPSELGGEETGKKRGTGNGERGTGGPQAAGPG